MPSTNNNNNNNKMPTNNTRGPPPGLRKNRPSRSAPSSGNSVHSSYSTSSVPDTTNNSNAAANNNALYNRERYLSLLLTMIGHTVTITKTNGQIIEGTFFTYCPFDTMKKGKNVYVVKGAKLISPKGGDDGKDSFQEGSTLLLSSSQVQSVHLKSIRLDTQKSNNGDESFRTDTEISGRKGGTDRLIAAGSVWTSGGGGELGTSTTTTTNNTTSSRGGMFATSTNQWNTKPTDLEGEGTIGNWDQFTANEQKFQIRATFDESLYTTTLNYKNLDAQKLAEAERIAKEIESTVDDNVHLREERGQALEGDYDEEDLYSGVLTKKKEVGGANSASSATAKTMNYAAAAGGVKKEGGESVEAGAVTAGVAALDVKKEETQTLSKTEEEKTDTPKEEETAAKEEATTEESKPKLNPNAKEFTFNPTAKSFTPTFTAPAAPAAPPVDYGMQHPGMMGNYHPGMQYMSPGGPGKWDCV